jgi:phage shock protein E
MELAVCSDIADSVSMLEMLSHSATLKGLEMNRTLAVIASLALLVGCSSSDRSSSDRSSSSESSAVDTTADSISKVVPAVGNQVVSVESAKVLSADQTVTVLDVRTPEEYASGHLERSTLIDFYEPDFQLRLSELDPKKKYLVYCRSGNRSGQATAMMKQMGFDDVSDLGGGVLAWEAAGESLVK